MIDIFESKSNNPYYNLAVEEWLLDYAKHTSSIVLYLWQNDNTVVFGRNQNIFTECNMDAVKRFNTKLVRRSTGGGAVYHDLGNLNFSIIVPKNIFDITRSSRTVMQAIRMLGIGAEISGRNDIFVDNKKISGNAYLSDESIGLHHGTILVNVDLDKMDNLLNVDNGKISKKGIKSVHSCVVNLKEVKNDIETGDVKAAIISCFCKEYNCNKQEIPMPEDNNSYLSELVDKYSSDEWNIGNHKEYQLSNRRKFAWGNVDILLEMTGNKIGRVSICSDSLFPDIIERTNRIINDGNRNEKISAGVACASKQEMQIVDDLIGFWNEIVEANA